MKRNNRNIVFCILAACLLLCSTSCKKDKATEMVTLKLALEQPTDPSNQKVYLDANKLVNWYTNDVIVINNGSGTFDASVVNNTANVQAGNGTFTALYPKTTTSGQNNTAGNGTVTVTIPAVQTYVEGSDGMQNLKDLPMGAYLTSSDASSVPVLMFRNLASLIKVTVTNPNATYTFRVNSIKLSSSAANLHGTYTYSFNNRSSNKTVPTVTSSTSPTYGKEIMLDFNHTWTTIAGGSSKDFYLVVAPVSTASSFTIDVRGAVVGEAQISGGENVGNNYTEAIKVYSKTLTDANGGSSSKKLARSIIGKVSANLSSFNVHGGFHVSSSKVSYFSHGNLSVGYNKGRGVYAFTIQGNGEQYNSMGSNNSASIRALSISSRSGVFLDLFNKVESGTINSGETHKYFPDPNGSGTGPNIFPAVSTYFPYATANIYSDAVNVWRVPTQSEWNYILGRTSRNPSFGHFAKAVIDGKNGLILFPDVYTNPNGITIAGSSIDNNNAVFSSNTLTYAEWKLMEAAGAIFLPTTGRVIRLKFYYPYPPYPYPGCVYDYGYNSYNLGADDDRGFYWGLGAFDQNGTRAHSRLVFNNTELKNKAQILEIEELTDALEATYYPGTHTMNVVNPANTDLHNWSYTQTICIAIRPIRD